MTPPFGAPLARFDAAWTRLESVLCVGVLTLEIGAFTFWIVLKGLSSTNGGESHAGLVFRAVAASLALAAIAHRSARSAPPRTRAALTFGAASLGIAFGRASGSFGATYFSNVLNWLQDSSSLTLLGGLRGVGTELTWLLAMIGASLATGSGKHINIDALVRFLRPPQRLPAVVFGWVMAAVVCFAAVWGFFDHIAIASFGAPAEAAPAEKVSIAVREERRHLFLLQKQLSLDTRTVLRVVGGDRYDSFLNGAEWNAWVDGGGWDAYFPEEQVAALKMPVSALGELHAPLVVLPSGGSQRGLFARDLHLVFPLGLLIVGIRLLLRALLVAMGLADLEGAKAEAT